jgi:anti-sigma B factor antagonist
VNLEQERRGEFFVLTPRKDLTGGAETQDLEKAVREIAAAGPPHIIVDLGRVSYINSTGLGSLVTAYTACRNRNGTFRVVNISKRIKNLFLITKLAFVFETFDTVEEALLGVSRDQSGAAGE